jgi:hypothetical protein
MDSRRKMRGNRSAVGRSDQTTGRRREKRAPKSVASSGDRKSAAGKVRLGKSSSQLWISESLLPKAFWVVLSFTQNETRKSGNPLTGKPRNEGHTRKLGDTSNAM